MKQSVLRLFALISLIAAVSVASFAQSSASSSLSGVVKDPNGAVVVGATVNVKNPGTGQEFSATTSDNGTFSIPAVSAGKYTVTIAASGFKTAVVKDVEVLAATPASVEVALQVGAAGETIQVTGAGEVLQTQSANVSNTIVGRQITDLPFASRNALDLVLFLPGTSSPARPRQSTVNGLPKGGLNITLDGINVQDNLLKSSDGFFTYIQPKTDAIDEVTVSSNTPGSESAGEGAVQVKFVTRSGNNGWNGSVYEYLRNPSLNANYYFNNLAGLPRARVILNQFGFRLGGPIIKDRAFFFVNYEEYRLPEQALRQRTILTPSALGGVYTYTGSDGVTRGINLYSIAGAATTTTSGVTTATPQTATVDPTIGALLNSIQGTTNQGSVQGIDQNTNLFSFINSGGQNRKFPTVRFDINLTSKEHIENIWNYQQFDNVVDFLNNLDPRFPGFPNHGAQTSNRFSETIALRSTLTNNLVNEFRFGLTGGTTRFFGEITPAQFANQGGFNLGIATAGITSATAGVQPQKRNSPVWQYQDNLNWTKGNHSLGFGFSLTQINLFSVFPTNGIVSGVSLGLDTKDPANLSNMFASSSGGTCATAVVNFPCASTAQVTAAQNLYSVLTGRVTAVSGVAVLNETTHAYTNNGNFIDRDHQREIGTYATDTWRFRPNLTLTGGVRWEVQFPFIPLNNNYAQTTVDQLYGPAGQNNIFGTTANAPGLVTKYTAFNAGDSAYNTQWGNIAPSVGIAWSPNTREGWLHKLGGESGQTVIRAGYSMAYVREGTNVVSSILGSNPGGTQPTSVSTSLNTVAPGSLFRNGAPPILPVPTLSYPITSSFSTSANAFLPDLKTGRVHSWTFGIQRELNKDTVVEVRYVGNRGMDMWRQYNINETNVVDNGFLNGEFKLAQSNFVANKAAGRGNSFAYFGPNTGTAPLPVSFAFLQGAGDPNDPSKYVASAGWASTTFTNSLNPALPSAIGLANNLMNNSGRIANALAAGLRANFFVPNMNIFNGGAFLVDNSNRSYYNGAVVELRRRLSKGLLFQGSYTFSKSMTNYFASSAVVAKNFITLRNPDLDRSRSPFDINHSLKANFIYEFPIGKGQRFLDSTNSIVDHLVSGWGINGTVRIQSGTPLGLGNVQLVGMSQQELQDAISIGHDVVRNLSTGAASGTSPVVTFLPLDIRMATFAAFNGTAFAPTGRYIAPANMNNPIGFNGATGYSNLILSGPRFTRFDLSFVKKTKITERINFEFRAELLNAFNNIDFRLTAATADVGTLGGFTSSSFGTTTLAYQDTSTTNDPGGRLVQFVARINF